MTDPADTRACLLLHGFTGGPFEVMPLADYLTRSGRHCRVPTLPGHDERGLRGVHWREWLQAAEREAESLANRFGKFDLVGFSMGGMIASYLANRYPVRRLVLLGAAVIYVSPARFASRTARWIRDGAWEQFRPVKKVPFTATLQFVQLANRLRAEIAGITAPTFIVQGGRDPVVHPRSARYIYDRVQGEKRLLMLPDAGHMLCLEPGAVEWFAQAERFLASRSALPNGQASD